jgi:hypothetical protein
LRSVSTAEMRRGDVEGGGGHGKGERWCLSRSHHPLIDTSFSPCTAFECPYQTCTKRFSRSDNLNQHIRIHRHNGKEKSSNRASFSNFMPGYMWTEEKKKKKKREAVDVIFQPDISAFISFFSKEKKNNLSYRLVLFLHPISIPPSIPRHPQNLYLTNPTPYWKPSISRFFFSHFLFYCFFFKLLCEQIILPTYAGVPFFFSTFFLFPFNVIKRDIKSI